MSRAGLTVEQLAAVDQRIDDALGDFTPFNSGPAVAPEIATPNGFGISKTEFSEGDPILLNASSVRRAVIQTDRPSTGALISTLLNFPVAAGDSWSVEWELYVKASAGALSGASLTIASPVAGVARSSAIATKAGPATDLIPFSVANPMVAARAVAAVNSGGLTWPVRVRATFLAFATAGTVDLKFLNVDPAETMTIMAGSSMIATRIIGDVVVAPAVTPGSLFGGSLFGRSLFGRSIF